MQQIRAAMVAFLILSGSPAAGHESAPAVCEQPEILLKIVSKPNSNRNVRRAVLKYYRRHCHQPTGPLPPHLHGIDLIAQLSG